MELISNNGYGMVMAYISWNQAERWRRNPSISTANTPLQPDFARPEQLGREKSEDWFHELKPCLRVISSLSLHTLDSRWLTMSLSSIGPQNLSPRINASLSSRSLEGFYIFEIGQIVRCSWCMILSRQGFSLLCDNKGICSSFPFILQAQTKCLWVAMLFKYFGHMHV